MEETISRDDYDSPWKEALDEYFKDFLELLFPMVHDGIDWSVPPQSRDKEFQKVTATAKQGRQVADKLKEVQTLDGKTRWVLVHIEIQSQWEADFAERIFRFDARIYDEFDKQVVSLVVLGDGLPDWKPNRFGWSFWGYEMAVRFPTVKLINLHVEWLEQSQNRFAPIVLAHLKTMETKNEDQTRREWKFRIVRSLYERGYSAEDVRKLFRIVDWFMQLPEELEHKFQTDLEEYEEQHHMPYITSIERMAEARGEARGEAQGRIQGEAQGLVKGRIQSKIESLLILLTTRFGAISAATTQIIQSIDDEARLTDLLRTVVMVSSLDEFLVELGKNEPNGA